MSQIQKPILGYHLLMDLHSEDYDSLSSMQKVKDFIEMLPSAIGMRPLGLPIIEQWLWPPAPAWGISALQMVTDSHLSLHTFPDKVVNGFKGFIHADVFSCKEFDQKKVIELFRGWFNVRLVGEIGQVRWLIR